MSVKWGWFLLLLCSTLSFSSWSDLFLIRTCRGRGGGGAHSGVNFMSDSALGKSNFELVLCWKQVSHHFVCPSCMKLSSQPLVRLISSEVPHLQKSSKVSTVQSQHNVHSISGSAHQLFLPGSGSTLPSGLLAPAEQPSKCDFGLCKATVALIAALGQHRP